MLKNYLKIAIRNISKNKLYSFINIAGLSIGMACFILIMMWVQDELSYELYNRNADRIFRVIWDIDGFQIAATPGPFANWLKETIPGIQEATRVNHTGRKLEYKDKRLDAAVRYIEPRFFDIFPFQFREGDPKTALSDVGSIIITQSAAQKLFGTEDPIGKTILQGGDVRPLKVTGVVNDIPRLTHEYLRQSDCFLSLELLRASRNPDSWEDAQDYKTYVFLNNGASYQAVSENINTEFKQLLEKNNPEAAHSNMKFFLQPLLAIHLHSDFKFENREGDIQYVVFFTLIAVFILITACINFMNLATARSIQRTKEVGLRKVVGASRFQLMKQFLGESILISAIAFTFALVIVELFLPRFNALTGKPLSVDFSNMTVLGGFICLLLVTGIVSGIYPALFLSSFTPIKILKGQIPAGGHTRSSVARRLLVIVQFTISIVLIIGTIIIYQQLDYMKNKDLGFDKENLIYLKTEDFSGKYDAIKNELLQHPEITGVSASGDMVLTIGDNTGANWEGKEKNAKYISFPSLFITEDFLQTFRLQLAEGRFFSKQFPADKTNAFVLNEAAVKAMRIKDPIGKKFNAWGKEGTIIGVVKDFNFRSLHSEVEPLILSLYGFRHLYVRMNSNDIGKTIETVKQIYHKHYPEHEFEVHFFDEEIDNLYQSERRMGSIFAYFSILAIFIACLGLFGLVSFVSENKTKEIGIRKVLGASFADVVSILTRDITMWALLANIVAWPVAYVAMNRWLQNFAYRMEIRWWVFLLAGGLTLLIALLTVCYEAVKAATANPVESLRYE